MELSALEKGVSAQMLLEKYQRVLNLSPYQGIDLEDANDVFDLGNLFKENEKELNSNFEKSLDRFNDIFKGKNLKDERIKLVTLGGEHSISIAPINKYLNDYDDLLIIHLDAHADLRDGYFVSLFSCVYNEESIRFIYS